MRDKIIYYFKRIFSLGFPSESDAEAASSARLSKGSVGRVKGCGLLLDGQAGLRPGHFAKVPRRASVESGLVRKCGIWSARAPRAKPYLREYRLLRCTKLHWSASLFKLNNDGCHVVGSEPLRGVQVGRAVHVHHHFHHGGQPRIPTIVYCIF